MSALASIKVQPQPFRAAMDHAFPTLAELRGQGVIKAIGMA